jgi:hypothetical protein
MENEMGNRGLAGPVQTNERGHGGKKISIEEWRTGGQNKTMIGNKNPDGTLHSWMKNGQRRLALKTERGHSS